MSVTRGCRAVANCAPMKWARLRVHAGPDIRLTLTAKHAMQVCFLFGLCTSGQTVFLECLFFK